jgi:hypothetical protein
MAEAVKLVYIAGPFRATTPWAVEQNIRRAEELALEVWALGAVAVCPHTNSRFFDKLIPDKVFLDGYLTLLARCDAVLLTGSWETSEGTRNERTYADVHKIPVFETLGDLTKWLYRWTLTV